MMNFNSLAGFAAFLSGTVAITEHLDHHNMEKACLLVENEAKGAIGTEKYGWTPLAEATIAKKGHDAPLLETGEMRDSIEHSVTLRFLGGAEGRVGSNSEKAVYQELGTSKIPPRSFLAEAARRKEEEVVELIGKGSIMPILTGRGAA